MITFSTRARARRCRSRSRSDNSKFMLLPSRCAPAFRERDGTMLTTRDAQDATSRGGPLSTRAAEHYAAHRRPRILINNLDLVIDHLTYLRIRCTVESGGCDDTKDIGALPELRWSAADHRGPLYALRHAGARSLPAVRLLWPQRGAEHLPAPLSDQPGQPERG